MLSMSNETEIILEKFKWLNSEWQMLESDMIDSSFNRYQKWEDCIKTEIKVRVLYG